MAVQTVFAGEATTWVGRAAFLHAATGWRHPASTTVAAAAGLLNNRSRMNRRHSVLSVLALGLPLFLAACSPALDWRELRPEGTEVVALFPCKANNHAREVSLAQHQVRMVLHACTAGGVTWALAMADLGDPTLVGPSLLELREAAARNLGVELTPSTRDFNVVGATPNPHSARLEIQGRLPDGLAVTEQVAVFAKGTRVFQATALGEELSTEAADTFFDALRAGP